MDHRDSLKPKANRVGRAVLTAVTEPELKRLTGRFLESHVTEPPIDRVERGPVGTGRLALMHRNQTSDTEPRSGAFKLDEHGLSLTEVVDIVDVGACIEGDRSEVRRPYGPDPLR